MKRIYSCPHCKAMLNPSVKIVMRVRLKGRKGLFLFSPKPGNYDVFTPPGFSMKKGDEVEFSCPVCGENFTSSKGKAWAEIRFQASPTSMGTVVFSRVFGHHATYFITEEDVRYYGEDAKEALNFWGVGPTRGE